MPVLLLFLEFLLIGHLAILAASQLRNFGLLGALQFCSITFDLCDDPLWVGCVAAVLFVGIRWLSGRSDSVPAQLMQEQTVATAKPEQRLHVRARGMHDSKTTWTEDDFDVVEGARVVGRIYRLTAGGDWLWGIVPEEMPPGRRALGREPSCERAKAAFSEAWHSRWRS
jgi:hypothetical protein